MKIFDYIFFRVYIVYLKKNDPARFASVAYMTVIYISLLFALLAVFIDLMRGIEKFYIELIYVISFLVILIFNIKRYNKKYILGLINKFKVNEVPSWLFFLIFPLSMIFGVMFYILLKKYVVDTYYLQGYLYNKLFM